MRRADGKPNVDLKPAVARQHIDLDPPLNYAHRDRVAVEYAAATAPERAFDRWHRKGDGVLDVCGLRYRQPLEAVKILDQIACDLDCVLGGMRVGPVRAWRSDFEHDSERALLAETNQAGR